eukprot:GHVR01123958.1.p1 GENE.GHVR01123958.1~~GHVR01123958.1.p1  ORF type:complete len:258 (+),score=88.73 GHVR01123958.1:61-834(+)
MEEEGTDTEFMLKIKAAIQGLREEADAERGRSEELQEQVESLQDSLEEANNTITFESEGRVKGEREVERLKEKIQYLENESTSLKESDEEYKLNILKLEREIEEARTHTNQSHDTHYDLQCKYDQDQIKIKDVQEERDYLVNENKKFKALIAQIEDKLDDETRASEAERLTYESQINRITTKYDNDIRILTQELEELRSARQKLELQVESRSSKQSELEKHVMTMEGQGKAFQIETQAHENTKKLLHDTQAHTHRMN